MTTPELLFARLDSLTDAERAEIRTRIAEWEELRAMLRESFDKMFDEHCNCDECKAGRRDRSARIGALLARTERGE